MVSLIAALSTVFLFLLIFGLSATVPCRNMKRHVSTHKRAMGLGLVIQYGLMPLLGLVTVLSATHLSSFTQPMGLLLLVVTSSPGGSFSNWWCSTWNADLALSVTMSTASSLLSVGLLPANIFLYSYLAYGRSSSSNTTTSFNDTTLVSLDNTTSSTADHDTSVSIVESLDYGAILMSLLIALVAVLMGLMAGTWIDTTRFHQWCHRVGTWSGVALVGCLLALSGGTSDDASAWWDQDPSLFVATTIPCVLGLAISHFAIAACCPELTLPERVALVIECCYQNTGLATSMAITMYATSPILRSQALAIPMVYGILEAVLVGLYGLYAWKAGWTKAPVHESLWTVWTTSYEIDPLVQLAESTNAKVGYSFTPESSRGCWSSTDVTVSSSIESDLVDLDLDVDEEEQRIYVDRKHRLPEPIIVLI